MNEQVALVTGANRGLGRAFVRELVARGARVYAGARDPATVVEPNAIPIRLDITNPAQVAAAAERCPDVTLLINNAGILRTGPLLTTDLREEMETNVCGTLAMARAFAPILGRNGGGTLVNILSVLSFMSLPGTGGYSASKAAGWSITNTLRAELRDQGTQVVAVHAAFIDTDMAAAVTQPKISPADVVTQTLDAIRDGREEVLTDDITRAVKASLSGVPA